MKSVLPIALMLFAAPAAAQGTLFLDATLNEVIDGEFLGCVETPRYAIQADVPEAGKAYFYEVPGAGGQVGCRIYFDHAVAEPMVLGDEVVLTMFYACERPAPGSAGSMFRAMLMKNGEEISRVAGGAGETCPTELTQLQFALDAKQTEFAAGDTLTIAVVSWIANPPPPGNENLYVAVGGESPTTLTGAGLPGSGSGAPDPDLPFARYQDVEGDFEATLSTQNASTGTVHYNWTLPAEDIVLQWSASGSGSIELTVDDGDERVLATQENGTFVLEGLAGPTTIMVNMTDFHGSFLLEGAAVEAEPTGEPAEPTEPATQTDGNATAPDPKESPAVGAMVLLGVLMLARRRR